MSGSVWEGSGRPRETTENTVTQQVRRSCDGPRSADGDVTLTRAGGRSRAVLVLLVLLR